jgi:hypothetical protein
VYNIVEGYLSERRQIMENILFLITFGLLVILVDRIQDNSELRYRNIMLEYKLKEKENTLEKVRRKKMNNGKSTENS